MGSHQILSFICWRGGRFVEMDEVLIAVSLMSSEISQPQ